MPNTMRDFMTIINESQMTPLTETVILMEGPLLDKIKATSQKFATKYGDLKYDLLARATNKALDLFSKGGTPSPVAGTIQKIARVGKFAINNRAVLAILIGMVGTLIGLAHNPASAAQAAHQIDPALSANDLDQLIANLQKAGVKIGTSALPDDVNSLLQSLPHDQATQAEKAVRALHALKQFSFAVGEQVSAQTESNQEFQITGNVQVMHDHFLNDIQVTTPDGSVMLGHIHTETDTVNGQTTVIDSATGAEFDLIRTMNKGLNDQQIKAMDGYVQHALDAFKVAKESTEGQGNLLQELEQASGGMEAAGADLLKSKAQDLSLMIAALVAGKPDGQYQVSVGPSGANVSPVGGAASQDEPEAEPETEPEVAPTPQAAPAPAQAAPATPAPPAQAAPATPAPPAAQPAPAPQAAPAQAAPQPAAPAPAAPQPQAQQAPVQPAPVQRPRRRV